jgi:hypothetical protein
VHEHLRARLPRLLEQLERPLGDARVRDGVQPRERLAVGEDLPPERGPVEAPVVLQDLRAEGVDDGRESRAADVHDLPRDEVGVDDRRRRARGAAGSPPTCPSRCRR